MTGILENQIRLIINILGYRNENDIEAILFSADFKKAFNSVQYYFINYTLSTFGVGAGFIQWVKISSKMQKVA